MFTLVAIASIALLQDAPIDREYLHACNSPTAEQPTVTGIRVQDEPARADDLPGLRVTNIASGGWMNIYYDAVSEPAARARAACFGAQIILLEAELGDDRRDAQWDPVVFTADPDYVSPRDAEGKGRWIVATRTDGLLGENGEGMITSTMPHEQVHRYQTRGALRRPRWFQEGHATLVGLKIAARLSPGQASTEIARHEAALAGAEENPALGAWGGMQVRPEAILRQLTPEDRARKLADPSFNPPGPFSFGPGDVVSDESNTSARYAAAWKAFQGLEARHGVDAVRSWAAEMTGRPEALTNAMIIAAAQERFGEDITPLLQ